MPKRSKLASTPDKFRCVSCGRVIDIPLCCDEEMALQKGVLACEYCGKAREVPVCCGEKMEFVPAA